MNIEEIMSTAITIPTGDPTDVDAPKGWPVLFWGAPGTGKSQRIKSGARSALLHCEMVFAGTKQPDDFSIPMPDGLGGITVIAGLPQVRRLLALKEGVLFLDEISCARPAVQSALLSLVLDRQCGDIILPPSVRIVAAANPSDVAAGGWDLEPPMANRFLHFDYPAPSPDEWVKWFIQEGGSKVEASADLWAKVTTNWPSAWPRAKGLFAGFVIKRGAELLNKVPQEGDPARGRAWPSGRMWEVASRAYATCHALGRSHLAAAFVEAAVGEGAADEFATWVRESDLPSPEDMLRNGWKPSRNRLDIAIAAYTAMTAYVVRRPDSQEQRALAIPAWKNLQVACESGLTDIALAAADSLVNADLADEDDAPLFDAARPVIRKLMPLAPVI